MNDDANINFDHGRLRNQAENKKCKTKEIIHGEEKNKQTDEKYLFLIFTYRGPIIYFFDSSSPSRYLTDALMEQFLEGSAPLRHWYNKNSNW